MDYVIRIINLSYDYLIGLSEIKKGDWCSYKSSNYRLNNQILFKSIREVKLNSTIIGDDYVNQFIIDCLGLITDQIIVSRRSINLKYGRNYFFFAIFLRLLSYLSFRYFKSLIKSIYVYNQKFSKKVIVSYRFPYHAFSFSDNNNCGPKFSYGEYLKSKYNFVEYQHIGMGTYFRQTFSGTYFDNFLKYHKLSNNFNYINPILFFLNNIYYFFKTGSFSTFLFKIIEIIYHNESKSLSALMDKNDIERIYKMATVNIGLLPYMDKYHHKIFNYVYSQNFCEFPTRFLNSNNPSCQDYDIGDFSIDAFLAFGPAVGYTNIWNYVSDYKKKYGIYSSKSSHIELQTHCQIGFENDSIKNNIDYPYILYFDINPYFTDDWKYHLLGNIFLTYDLVKDNIIDICTVARLKGYKVLLKPKYDLVKYSKEYLNLLDQFKDVLIFLNPYSRSENYLKNSKIILNHPYTTTKILGEYYNKNSFFYLSTSNADLIDKKYLDNNFIVGVKDLISYL